MENFQEVKTSLIEQLKDNDAFSKLLERVIKTKNWSNLKKIICDNTFLCNYYGILIPDGHYKNSKKESTVLNGQLHGEYIEYHKNGKVCVKCKFFHGQLHGEYICFYQTGKIRWKSNYENGQLHGEFAQYYINGNVWQRYKYVNAQLYGEYVEYSISGDVIKKYNYIYGQLVEAVC